jgi:hypothetical protein
MTIRTEHPAMKRGTAQGKQNAARREAAEALAIAALGYLASEPEHLGGFLAATGIGPDQIRSAARDPEFLSGVLDYFSGDEALLVAFAKDHGIDPNEIERARAALGGVWERDLP